MSRERWWFVMVGGSHRSVVVWGPFDTEDMANETAERECEPYPYGKPGHPGYFATCAVPNKIEALGAAARYRRELKDQGY